MSSKSSKIGPCSELKSGFYKSGLVHTNRATMLIDRVVILHLSYMASVFNEKLCHYALYHVTIVFILQISFFWHSFELRREIPGSCHKFL